MMVYMTGPEHYREAERLIKYANGIPDGFPGDEYAQTIQTAHVHATLANAAATALTGIGPEGPIFALDVSAWYRAAGTKPVKVTGEG
jgi:hypothetical protein